MTTLSGFTLERTYDVPVVVAGTAVGQLVEGGVYRYVFTHVSQFGESLPCPASDPFTATASLSANVTIPASPENVIARRLYRSANGGTTVFYRIAEVDGHAAATVIDTFAQGVVEAPTYSTAHSEQTIGGVVHFEVNPTYPFFTPAAAGADQATATELQMAGGYYFIGTSGVGTGVRLPHLYHDAATDTDPRVGATVIIRNNSANTINVYPASGQNIHGSLADVPVTLAANTTANFFASFASWYRY